MYRNGRANRDICASDSQHKSNSSTQHSRIRKLTRDEEKFENHNSTYMNREETTNTNRLSLSELEIYADRPSVSSLYHPAPFNDDPEAIETRAKCDYSIKITKEMAASGKSPRQVRVYADGIYDLFHQGHARLLMQAKNAFPSVYLLAGVNSDLVTNEHKGKTVMSENERYEIVRHCRYVDEVIKDADWVPHDKFLEDNKIDFVAHDDLPYPLGTQDDLYKGVKNKGMFVATKRAEGISTSDLVTRVVRDYDLYVHRNLGRGYTGKDLYLSFLYEKKFFLQKKLCKIKEKFVENRNINEWRENTRKFVDNFLNLFGKNDGENVVRNGKLRQSPAQTPTESSMKRRERSLSPAAKPCRMDRSARDTVKNHLTSNYAFLLTILLLPLIIHLLVKYNN